MPAGLSKSVAIPVSGLLSRLGDKRYRRDDGSIQPGFLARGKHHADMPVRLPEPGKTRIKMAVSSWG